MLRVLRAHRVFVAVQEDGKTYTVIRGDFVEAIVLGHEVRPKQIRTFWRKLDIPIHHFWHPEEAEAEAEAKTKKNPESS